MSFMEYDSPLNLIIGRTVDLIVLSVLWLICSLPIITIGASTSALYYAAVKSVRRNRGYAAKNFFHAFRINLKQGTILTVLSGLFLALLYICFLFAAQIPDPKLQ